MGDSISFGRFKPLIPHAVRSELGVLRTQVDKAFSAIEAVVYNGPDGPSGPDVPSGPPSYIAGTPISALHAVMLDDQSFLYYAQPVRVGGPMGISTSSGQAGAPITVISSGDLIDFSFNWDPMLPIVLGLHGQLTQSLEGLAVLWILGGAVSQKHMVVRLSGPFLLG